MSEEYNDLHSRINHLQAEGSRLRTELEAKGHKPPPLPTEGTLRAKTLYRNLDGSSSEWRDEEVPEGAYNYADRLEVYVGQLRAQIKTSPAQAPKETPQPEAKATSGDLKSAFPAWQPPALFTPERTALDTAQAEHEIECAEAVIRKAGGTPPPRPEMHHSWDAHRRCIELQSHSSKLLHRCREAGVSVPYKLLHTPEEKPNMNEQPAEEPKAQAKTMTQQCIEAKGKQQEAPAERQYTGITKLCMDAKKKGGK